MRRLVALALVVALVAACSDDDDDDVADATPTTTTTTEPRLERYREELFGDVRVESDVVYGSAPGVDGELEDLTLDLYRPWEDAENTRPLVIWAHGGGFASGDKAGGPSHENAILFARLGYVTASINYRLLAPLGCRGGEAGASNECQTAALEAVHDAQAAVRFLRAHAGDYGIDPHRIAIGGESAGGVMATGVGVWTDARGSSGTPEESSEVQAWISISGGLPGGIFVDDLDAPGLLFAGTADPVVPYQWSLDMQTAMEKIGVPVELVTFDGAGHVPWGEHREEMQAKSIEFLYEHLRLKAMWSPPSPRGKEAPLDLVTGDAAMSCAEAAAQTDLSAFVSAFVEARLAGRGAEPCLSPDALDAYCLDGEACGFDSDPGPICLYACQGGKVIAIDAGASKRADGSYGLYLQTDLDGEWEHQNEGLTVSNTGGRLLVVEASTSA